MPNMEPNNSIEQTEWHDEAYLYGLRHEIICNHATA
jgi:hypothetical protein